MEVQRCDICGAHVPCSELGDSDHVYLVLCAECNTIDVVEDTYLDGLTIHNISDELDAIKDTIRMAELLNALDEEVCNE